MVTLLANKVPSGSESEEEVDLEEEKVEPNTTVDDHTEQHVPQTNNEVSGVQLPNSEVELVYVQDTQHNEYSEEESEVLVGRTLRNAESEETEDGFQESQYVCLFMRTDSLYLFACLFFPQTKCSGTNRG